MIKVIRLINIHKKIFKNHKDPLSFFPLKTHGHYTELGYKTITKKVIEKINEID